MDVRDVVSQTSVANSGRHSAWRTGGIGSELGPTVARAQELRIKDAKVTRAFAYCSWAALPSFIRQWADRHIEAIAQSP